MRITYNNMSIVKELSFHDLPFEYLSFNYENGKLKIGSKSNEARWHMVFSGMIHYEMLCFEPWGYGNSIVSLSVDDNGESYERVIDMHKKDKYKISKLDDGIKFIVVKMLLNSGDCLEVVCESLEFDFD